MGVIGGKRGTERSHVLGKKGAKERRRRQIWGGIGGSGRERADHTIHPLAFDILTQPTINSNIMQGCQIILW